MALTQAFEALARKPISGREAAKEAMDETLRQAVSLFALRRADAISTIRNLQAKDPANFVRLRRAWLLTNPDTERLPGAEYVGGLISGDDSLIDLLVDEKALTHEEAFSMVRRMAASRPMLEARLLRKMLENADGLGAAVPREIAQRVMSMVEAISDSSRVTVYLTQLERHPSAEVRSKAALLLGRGNVNVGRVRRFLTSQDARLRANAVESLWGMNTPQARALFWTPRRIPIAGSPSTPWWAFAKRATPRRAVNLSI